MVFILVVWKVEVVLVKELFIGRRLGFLVLFSLFIVGLYSLLEGLLFLGFIVWKFVEFVLGIWRGWLEK